MNKLMDIAIINRSAKNTATAHIRNRCAALGEKFQKHKKGLYY